jgi:DNA-directed RNA polymerase specialized sigma24 family protein
VARNLQRYYRLNAKDRDKKILELRRAGFSYREIGARVGMSANGVMHSLRRMAEGRPGLDPRT